MEFLYIILWALLGIWGLANITSAFGQIGLVLFLVITLVAIPAAYRGSRPFTSSAPVFFASRWSKNNLIFPTQVAIDPTSVTRHKVKPIGVQEEAISISQIASVKIDTGLLWSNVIIDSTGGTNPIICHGHLNADARQMQTLIQQYQEDHFHHARAFPDPRRPPCDSPAEELTVSLTLTAPPVQRGSKPTTLSHDIRHLPPRDEEERLDITIDRLLRQAPPHSRILITSASAALLTETDPRKSSLNSPRSPKAPAASR